MQGINKLKEKMSLCGEPSGPRDQTLKVEVSESGPQNHDLEFRVWGGLTHCPRLRSFPGGF